jgi:GDP-L-fucose synthase
MNIYIAGHKGMVGSAIVRNLKVDSENKIIQRTHSELDLTNQESVNEFISREKIDQIYLAAAKVGGINANNSYPADFIYQNLMIQSNIINAAYVNNIQKLLFLGSSCIYPREVKQPISEDALLNGRPDPTNEPYAIAKIAGIKLCESYNRQHNTDFRSVMPTNLYGPGDNYDLENGHVIPALIRRFHEAKLNNDSSVIVWGTGEPKREFLYVDDMAEASIRVMNLDKSTYNQNTQTMLSHINVGCGYEITIRELAETISKVTNYKGDIIFDSSKLNGSPRKLIDSSCINRIGWYPKVDLEDGLRRTYNDLQKNYSEQN